MDQTKTLHTLLWAKETRPVDVEVFAVALLLMLSSEVLIGAVWK